MKNAIDFSLSSDDCRLLLLLEITGSIRDVSVAVGRDISVVSRQVSRLANESALLEKIGGKWQVSEAGRRMNAWTRDAILSQRRTLSRQYELRIASTPEFSSRVLAPQLGKILEGEPQLQITILARDEGVERSLLSGEADIGLDCGRPTDPGVKFLRVAPEPFAIVASPKLAGQSPLSMDRLLELPHLGYLRFSSTRALQLPQEIASTRAWFSDLASLRSACVAGLGWATVPRYAVEREIEAGELREVRLSRAVAIEPESFGVWWMRERKSIDPWVKKVTHWLKSVKL